MLFRIKLANRIIQIESLYDFIYGECRDYIIPLNADVENDIEIRIMESDIAAERKPISSSSSKGEVFHDGLSNDEVLEVSAVHRKVLDEILRFDTLLVHGTLIATDGHGYLITAPSGVGKSTRAALWKRVIPDSYIVNGDKPLFALTETGATGFGTPWCGKERWNVNTCVPLKAVLFLERTEQNSSVEEMGLADAMPRLLAQARIPEGRDNQRLTIRLLSELLKHARCFSYRVAPTEGAVLEAYSYIVDACQ